MSPVVAALAPIFLLIVIGHWLRHQRVAPNAFWRPADWMTFHIFFPALLIRNIAVADLSTLNVLPLIMAAFAGVVAVAIIVRLLRGTLALSGPAYTSVFQGSMRPNVYLGIAIALALYGEAGVAAISVCIAVLVPVVNVLAVVVLIRHAGKGGHTPKWRQTIAPMARHPLILACAVGGALNALDVAIPPVADPLLHILGQAALPLALLSVGAGLSLHTVRRDAGVVALTSFLKVAALPALTFGACLALNVNGVGMAMAVLYAALPGSGTSYVMARQMGGDAELLAGSITVTTLVSAATLPALLLWLG